MYNKINYNHSLKNIDKHLWHPYTMHYLNMHTYNMHIMQSTP